jgi:hypothetical protein
VPVRSGSGRRRPALPRPSHAPAAPASAAPTPVLLFTSLLLLFPCSVFYSVMLKTLALTLIECIVMKVGLNGRTLFLFSMVNEVAILESSCLASTYALKQRERRSSNVTACSEIGSSCSEVH